ncbi:hypothetical protein ONZ45_g18883 [Pleurotus djamor]|nr:hypothetical protein ONZ45_g18883 [Pleurotus djamor]
MDYSQDPAFQGWAPPPAPQVPQGQVPMAPDPSLYPNQPNLQQPLPPQQPPQLSDSISAATMQSMLLSFGNSLLDQQRQDFQDQINQLRDEFNATRISPSASVPHQENIIFTRSRWKLDKIKKLWEKGILYI